MHATLIESFDRNAEGLRGRFRIVSAVSSISKRFVSRLRFGKILWLSPTIPKLKGEADGLRSAKALKSKRIASVR
jgi:hypothetical protein